MCFTSWEICTRKYVVYVIRINNHHHSVEYPGAMICCNLRGLVITSSQCAMSSNTQNTYWRFLLRYMMILASHTALAENHSHSFGGDDLLSVIDCNQKKLRFPSCKCYIKLHQLADLQIFMTKINLKGNWWLKDFKSKTFFLQNFIYPNFTYFTPQNMNPSK